MKKILILFLFVIVSITINAQTASFSMKTEASKVWNTDYTLTNEVADTFVFHATRIYPATQSYSIHLDSVSGDHTNIAVSLYGSLLGVTYTQIGSTANWVTGASPTHDTTISITNTSANRYNYYKTIVLGTGTGVATIGWQRLQTWSSGNLSDGVATLSNGAFSGITTIAATGAVTITKDNDIAIIDMGTDLHALDISVNAAAKATIDTAGNLVLASDATVTGGDVTGANGNAIDIGEAADGTITFSRDDAGTVTLTSADNNGDAALTVSAGGGGALTIGDAGSTTAITSGDWAIGATGIMTGIGNITTDGTINGLTILNNKGRLVTTATSAADSTTASCLLSAVDQFVTVTSGGATRIICLPAASSTTVGLVIEGVVGANGFELRVATSQAASVKLNDVTTSVEAAIPATSNFRVVCVSATEWVLTASDEKGAVITAIVPDAL